jgi:sugar transferase (PEP-CTERM system associated)
MVNLIRLHASFSALAQLLFDVGLFFGALVLALFLQRTATLQPTAEIAPAALLFGVVMALVNAMFGLYRRDHPFANGEFTRRAILAMLVGFPLAYALYFASARGTVLQDAAPYAVLFGLSLAIALRKPVLARTASVLFPRRILVVGTGRPALEVSRVVESLPSENTHVVGFVAVPVADVVAVPRDRIAPANLSIHELVSRLGVDEIIVAVREQRGGVLPVAELLECRALGVRVSDLPAFFERVRGEVPIEALKASWLIYGDGFRQGRARRAVKRFFDVVLSALILIVAAPVMVLTAFAILLESGGPVIYRQERVGRGGRLFVLLKFRSMRHDAEPDGQPRWADERDGRVTAVGRFIRKMRIDELPQLVNVLRGEMSLVGPRPERPSFVEDLSEQIPFYELRHTVKPGVTGWAQIRAAYGASVEDAKRKLQFDLYYVKNHSLFLDLLIVIETIRVVLFAKGAR